MALMDSMMIKGETHSESTTYQQKKGAWFDWLNDELEAENNGWDVNQMQLKKGKSDANVNWADPCAWQKARTTVPTSASPALADHLDDLEESDTESCSWATLSCDSEGEFCECDSNETDAESIEDETDVEYTTYQHKTGAWSDWLIDELEANNSGWDVNELQLKKGKDDAEVNWADPCAWQKAKTKVPTAPSPATKIAPTAEDTIQDVTIEVQNALSGATVCIAKLSLCDTLDKLCTMAARELKCPCSYVQLLDGQQILDFSQTLKGAGLGDGSIVNVLRRPSFLVTSSADHTAKLWDTVNGECFRTLSGHTGNVHSAVPSPDNQFILTCSEDETVKLWVTETGACVLTLSSGHGSVLSADISPDGQHIAAGTESGAVLVWSITSGECKLTIDEGDGMPVRKVYYSPDGRFILTANGTWDCGASAVWDAETGEAFSFVCGVEDIILDAQYSPDGTSIVTGCGDDTVMVWDVESGELQLELEGHDGAVYATQFSPNGRRILTGSSDCTAKLWNAKTSQCLSTLKGHCGEVTSVNFSPDGATAATGSTDNTARIWATKGSFCRVVMEGHTDAVLGVQFSRT